MKKLKTLDQHNEEISNLYTSYSEPKLNGILCPVCKESELWDSDPTITLTSHPPQTKVHCTNCGYRGTRYI